MPKLTKSYEPKDVKKYLESVVDIRDVVNLEKNSNLTRKWDIGKKAANIFGIHRNSKGEVKLSEEKGLIKYNANTLSNLASQVGLDNNTLRNCIKFYKVVDLSTLRKMLTTFSDLNKPIFTWRVVLLIMRFEDNLERLNIINLMLDRKITIVDLKKKLFAASKPRKSPDFARTCDRLERALKRALTEAEKSQEMLSKAEAEVANEIARDRAALLHVTGAALSEILKKQNILLNNATNED